MDDKNKIRHLIIVWLLFIAIVGIVGYLYISNTQHVMGASGEPEEIVTDRYYLITSSKDEAKNAANEVGGKLESFADGVAVITVDIPVHKFLGVFGVKSAPEEIKTKRSVLKKEAVYSLAETKAPAKNTDFDLEWYWNSIKMKNTYKNNITGKGVLVAVIDSGCQINHSDIRGNIYGYYNAADPSRPKDVTDISGHGTHVAGIIAAEDNGRGIVGIAPDASLFIIKASNDKDGRFYTSDIIRGINKAIDVGADVINMSFGGYVYNEDLEDAVNRASNNGALCIAAAGNGSTNKAYYPAAYKACISVASCDSNGKLSAFSNYGDLVDIVAPGEDIWSLYLNNDYGTLSGTSMAAPMVSGVAALIYGNDLTLKRTNTRSSRDKVASVILSTKSKTTYSSTSGNVSGGLNVQNIFNCKGVKTPSIPTVTVKKQVGTSQQIVTLECKDKNADIYYTTNGTYPYIGIAQKYKNKIHLDKKGLYKLRVVAVNKRVYSKLVRKDVSVTGKVYSQQLLKSMEIHFKNKNDTSIGIGEEKQLYVTFGASTRRKVDLKLIKWYSSNPKLITISDDGVVKVTSDKNKTGKKVTVTGKFGSVTKTFDITVVK